MNPATSFVHYVQHPFFAMITISRCCHFSHCPFHMFLMQNSEGHGNHPLPFPTHKGYYSIIKCCYFCSCSFHLKRKFNEILVCCCYGLKSCMGWFLLSFFLVMTQSNQSPQTSGAKCLVIT